MTRTPIGYYALLSDRHSAALVSREGSVDWLCFPRFDSPSVFARILDDSAGHWSIHPAGPATSSSTRRYLDGTMVLETRFETATGSVSVTDALATGRDERGHDLGAGAVHTLLRQVTGRSGSVDVELDCTLRPGYGLERPRLEAVDGGVVARSSTGALVLSSAVPVDIRESAASTRFTVEPGESIGFALQHVDDEAAPLPTWTPAAVEDRLGDTIEAWRTWSA